MALTNGHTNSMRDSRSSKRNPNWSDFYKNGVPKEIIVIDDDDDEPAPHPPRQTQATRPALTNGASRHTDKKRKTTASTAYDPVYNQQTSYSTTQTPYYDNSPSNNTVSTDRTTSAINTTAATSLGSTASNGTYIPPLENGVVGQKRKRTTRQAAQAEAKEAREAKRREIDPHGDPFSLYVPPPNPPIKAKEVFVQVVPDVSFPNLSDYPVSCLQAPQKSYLKDQKVDDEDGHYIVVPEAELTERCTPPNSTPQI
jgi:dual-specificity kinase